jgi:hypothetical protein
MSVHALAEKAWCRYWIPRPPNNRKSSIKHRTSLSSSRNLSVVYIRTAPTPSFFRNKVALQRLKQLLSNPFFWLLLHHKYPSASGFAFLIQYYPRNKMSPHSSASSTCATYGSTNEYVATLYKHHQILFSTFITRPVLTWTNSTNYFTLQIEPAVIHPNYLHEEHRSNISVLSTCCIIPHRFRRPESTIPT